MRLEDVKKIGVLGTGIMGAGIAEVCARAGYSVVMRDISEEFVKKGFERIKISLTKAVERGKITKEEFNAVLNRIKGVVDLAELRDADIIIEAVPENMELKKKLLKELDELCPQNTIFASNTSSLMITEMASATKRPDRFVGMHWFNPAPIMKLIELVRGILTSDETFNLISELSVKLGKSPIEAKDGPGFFTSRYLAAFLAEGIRLLEAGVAGAKEIDTLCRLAFNHPMGPIELSDLIGLDTVYHICEYVYKETAESHYAPPLLLKKLVNAGFLGDPRVKAGSRGGFYEYFGIKRE